MILENRDTKNKCKLYTGENIFKYAKWIKWTFTKNKERIQIFKEIEDARYICYNKACFQHDMAYGDFKY